MQQRSIPCLYFRAGTSKGPFFRAEDLPSDVQLRDRVLRAVMGSPDRRQIDGLGGAHPLTSKVGIVSRSERPGVDLDFLFAQLQPDSEVVDTTPNCGNMLAAVVPFGLETGMVPARQGTTTVRVHTINTGLQCDISVNTPDGAVDYDGMARIDGAPGRSAPITLNFLDTAGSVCSSMLPTGNLVDEIDGVRVTCIDNGMPMVLFEASSVGCTGEESVDMLNADTAAKSQIERLRLAAGLVMGLGDVTHKNYPKMCLLSASMHGGTVSTRCFIPHTCHDAIGVLAAVTVATACVLEGTVADGLAELAQLTAAAAIEVSVEHPTGEFTVELELDESDRQKIRRAALLRTARLLMRGEVLIPSTVWPTETTEVPQ